MSKEVTNVLFAGIGGQGIILASDLLSEIAFRAGFDVAYGISDSGAGHCLALGRAGE